MVATITSTSIRIGLKPLVDANGQTASDRKLRNSRAALSQLDQASDTQKASRKAAAQEKLARLKARLQQLMMVAGGDPKVVARQAAQIAKEIASAVKEYAAAGGQDPGMSAAPSAPSPAQGESPSPDAGEAPDVQAANPDVAVPDQGADPAVAAAKGPGTKDAIDAEDFAKAKDDEKDADPADPAKGRPFPGSMRDEFMEEARRLAKLAKSIIDREVDKAKHQGASGSEMDKLQEAGAGAEQQVDKAASNLLNATLMGFYLSGFTTPSAPTSAISVQA